MAKPNLTFPTGMVLAAISRGSRHGFDIIEATGLPSGTVYPALRRLEGAQCLTSQWEAQEEAEAEGRPSRCYYALTPTGISPCFGRVLAIKSHKTKKLAPPRIQLGPRRRWSAPRNIRKRCGINNPTKPINPD